MTIIKNIYALLRANAICCIKKIFSSGTIQYNPKIRFFKGATISVRNKGKISVGGNVRLDANTLVASNGGKLSIGENVGLGSGNVIVSQKQITIGKNTLLGPNVFVYDHDHQFDSENGVYRSEYVSENICIGENCWIGANTVILKGTTIGDNCLIGAGCVIKGNIPAGSKVVQKRDTKIIERD